MGQTYQVHHPHVPRAPHIVDQPNAHDGDRFSWTDTSRPAPEQRYTTSIQNQSTHHIVETQYNTNTHPSQHMSASQSQQAALAKSREAQMSQQAYYNAAATAQADTLPPKKRVEELKDEKKDPSQSQHLRTRPEPDWSKLGPDENPLTPTSPRIPSHVDWRNTNIGVLPPQTVSHTTNDYGPVPQETRGGSWQYGLCSCAEPAICVKGIFCPCVLYGRVQYRLNKKSDQQDPTNLLGYKNTNGSCLAWSFLCGINGILSGVQKSRVRRAYEMEPGSGNLLSDCLAGCCCCCCVVAQNEKEFKFREQQVKRAPGGRQQGYVPPGGMTFSPSPR